MDKDQNAIPPQSGTDKNTDQVVTPTSDTPVKDPSTGSETKPKSGSAGDEEKDIIV